MSPEERHRIDLDELLFDDEGLIPVIVQDVDNGDVLMFAWSDREALDRTIAEGRMVYWSRSRRERRPRAAFWSSMTIGTPPLRSRCCSG